jgi:hypothetical protein
VAAPVAAYVVLTVATGLRIGRTLRAPSVAPLAGALIAAVHLSYGVGVLRGLVPRGRARPETAAHWTVPALRGATSEPAAEAQLSAAGEPGALRN